jgi:hypothetical protein
MRGREVNIQRHGPFRRGSTAIFCVAGALMFAAVYFAVATWEVSRVEEGQRSQLIEMTNGFVSIFGEH